MKVPFVILLSLVLLASVWLVLAQPPSLLNVPGMVEEGMLSVSVARKLSGRDKVKVLRTFHELLYSYSPHTSLPVLRSYLKDPDPYTRYNAARCLMAAGDDSGVPVLMAMLKSEQLLAGITKDLRVDAALVLAKYHQTAATADMLNLQLKVKDWQLSVALANLGASLPISDDLPFVESELALIQYAQRGTTRFLPQIRTLFERTDKPDLKAAAAWALATITGDKAAMGFLVTKACAGLDKANMDAARDERKTIKYVGAIQNLEAKRTLEETLKDADAVVVQTAIVNLLFNQGGSDLAIQKIADQLDDSAHAKLPWEFVYQVVAKFGENPVLKSAGHRYAERNREVWRKYVEERKAWPSDNWTGDYMIQLKR